MAISTDIKNNHVELHPTETNIHHVVPVKPTLSNYSSSADKPHRANNLKKSCPVTKQELEMLIASLIFIAATALGFVFPWVRRREQPPRLLLWIAFLALAIAGLSLGLPIEDIIMRFAD